MRLDTYLNYGGNCEAAFRFYEEHLGARITSVRRHADQPGQNQVPPGYERAVLHARLELGGAIVMGADVSPDRFQPMRSAYLTLTLDTEADAERIYALLIEDGQVFMPMEQTFFANRFAMLRDRFGTSWMLLQGNMPA